MNRNNTQNLFLTCYKYLAGLLLLTCFTHSGYAQNAAVQWKCHLNNNTTFFDLKTTADGGYIAAGAINTGTTATSGENAWLVKTDDTGGVIWQKSYGGTAQDRFTQVLATTDGGYIAAGFTLSNDGDVSGNNGGMDYWVVKTDDTGAIQWAQCYGGSNHEQINTLFYGGGAPLMSGLLVATPDGGYALAGTTNSNNGDVSGYHGATHTAGNYRGDIWMIKIDSLGELKWQKCIGGSMNEWPSTVLTTADGGFIIGAVTSSSDGDATGSGQHGGRHSVSEGGDYWVIKTDSLGSIQWQKCYGGSSYEVTTALIACSQGGYLVAGGAYSTDGDVSAQIPGIGNNAKTWLVKIDDTGSVEWDKSYWIDTATNNFGTPNWETLLGVVENIDGTFNLMIASPQFYGMAKVSDTGIQKTYNLYGNNAATQDYPGRFLQLADGSYVSAGGYSRAYTTLTSTVYVPKALLLKFEACPFYTYEQANICKGATYPFGNQLLTTAGIYWDTLAMSSGCDSLVRLKLLVDSIATPVISANAHVLSTGSYVTYQWLNAANNPISGATGQSFEATASGAYRVVVSGENGCTDTSAVYTHQSSNIHEAAAFAGLRINPNPAQDILNIVLPGQQEKMSVSLLSTDGRVLKTQTFNGTTASISMQQLPAGMYWLHIKTSQGITTRKIVKN